MEKENLPKTHKINDDEFVDFIKDQSPDVKEITKLLKESSGTVNCCTLPLIVNKAEENGYTKGQVMRTIELLMKKGEIYLIPQSICWLKNDN